MRLALRVSSCSALAMTLWLTAGDARAGLCPGPTPQFAEQIPAPALQYCAGGSCTKPVAPSVVAGTAYPQEITITTTVPSDIPTAEILIMAEAGNSSVATLWTYQLTHTPGSPFTANQTVTFGAPGLIEAGTNNYFRVSFCNAASGQCTCWSERSAVVSLPSFTSIGPAPPAASAGGTMALRVEDNFNRPDTNLHCRLPTDTVTPLGDGLGPVPQGAPASTGVWSDCPTPTSAEGVRIKSNAAYSTPSSVMTYTRQQAVGQHAYAEALFRVADPGTTIKYNLQSFTRQYYDASTSTVRFWAAKLMLDIRGCSVPTLGLYRFPDEYGQGGCGNQPAGANLTIPTPDPNDKCDEVPPLVTDDPNAPAPLPSHVSRPVWLRVEVYNVLNQNGVSVPKIVGTVAWGNCPAGQDILQCEHVCQHSRVDGDAPQSATNQFGAFGVGFHDKYYFVDMFRAGSELAP